ncbi:TetR family transcriptional regulator [Piscinibacter sp.]|uniref:TetR family transcriptional regulator n=1 Tax=Piscinibacter sp. TaxID=1903157 RepID=UPI002CC8910B|nr:TetR family transcriptional regulator [Albitalea sp.]HUG23744.1 TetR family transcriptional regulator [Albitalea sp.]
MPRRTKEEALETRHRILDAAELIFERRGVSRTSLQDIAQAAHVTRGAIYWHFKDKADLFTAMMERATMPMEAAYQTFDADRDDPLPFIERQVVETLRIAATNAQVRRAFDIATHKVEYVDELLAVRDRRLDCRNECLAEGERILKCAALRGEIAPRTAVRTLALGLHALVDGLIQTWMLDPQAFDLVQVGRQAVRSFINGMRSPHAADAPRPALAKKRREKQVQA